MITKLSSTLYFATFLALMLLATTKTAHAYLDAGTGSMIIQVVAGVLLGGLAFFKHFFGSIKGPLKKSDKKSSVHEKKSTR